MPHRKRLSGEQLKRTLRHWDPTHGDADLTSDERREMRGGLTLLAVRPAPSVVRHRWAQFALAAGAGLAVMLAAWTWRAPQKTPSSAPSPPSTETQAVAERITHEAQPEPPVNDARDRLQVQFMTRGGTRIVWLINTKPSL